MDNLRVEEIINFLNTYKIVDYPTILKFFNGQYSQIERLLLHKNEQVAVIVTGPIASGKSTMVYNIINSHLFGDMEFKSTDTYLELSGVNFSEQQKKIYEYYKSLCYEKIESAVKQGHSFIWETVISKEEKFKWIDYIKANGYKIIGIYIGNDNIELNIDRAQCREKQGKWHVGEDKIISRYDICMSNLKRFSKAVDEAIIVDTTNNNAHLAAYCDKGKLIYKDSISCMWVNQYM